MALLVESGMNEGGLGMMGFYFGFGGGGGGIFVVRWVGR